MYSIDISGRGSPILVRISYPFRHIVYPVQVVVYSAVVNGILCSDVV